MKHGSARLSRNLYNSVSSPSVGPSESPPPVNPKTSSAARALALLLALAGAAPAPAQAPAAGARDAPLTLPAAQYLARLDDVSVRAEPGFVYREVSRLMRGDAVIVDGRKGDWLRVKGGGWVFHEHVWTPEESAAAAKIVTLVVVKEGARVRATPGTSGAITDTLSADTVVRAERQDGEWWQLENGGWISGSLVRRQETGPASALAQAAASASTPQHPLPWVVAVDSASVRAQRATDAPVVRALVRGDVVVVSRVVEGWAEVPGGWVRQAARLH